MNRLEYWVVYDFEKRQRREVLGLSRWWSSFGIGHALYLCSSAW